MILKIRCKTAIFAFSLLSVWASSMKRKIVVEEYGQTAPRSRWDQLVNFFAPTQVQESSDFYPIEEKKHFFNDGSTYRTVAFANGLLFGGCLSPGCVESCLPIKDFPPDGEMCARAFQSFVRVHHAAVSCGDLAMASEYREWIEQYRNDFCKSCQENSPVLPLATLPAQQQMNLPPVVSSQPVESSPPATSTEFVDKRVKMETEARLDPESAKHTDEQFSVKN